MSYKTIAQMSSDDNLFLRVGAAAATQKINDPLGWAWSRQWKLATQPGWDTAYAYAINANNPAPGNDEGVITDAMILSAVQAIITAEAATSPTP